MKGYFALFLVLLVANTLLLFVFTELANGKQRKLKLSQPLKDTAIVVEIPKSTIWRVKLFLVILRFAAWVGGFGGVECAESETE